MNIVFDFGGVVFTWNSKELVAQYFSEPEVCNKVHKAIFGHPDWAEVDRGTLSLDEATRNSAERAGKQFEEISRVTYAVPQALVPIPATIELIKRVKERGHTLFALSNMGIDAMQHLRESYDFFDLFDHLVISSEIKMVKPEDQIFQYLINTYQLDTRQTIFIDDYAPNIETAARFGIQTIHFASSTQCEAELIRLGCL